MSNCLEIEKLVSCIKQKYTNHYLSIMDYYSSYCKNKNEGAMLKYILPLNEFCQKFCRMSKKDTLTISLKVYTSLGIKLYRKKTHLFGLTWFILIDYH